MRDEHLAVGSILTISGCLAFFISTIVTGLQTDCSLLDVCPSFECLLCSETCGSQRFFYRRLFILFAWALLVARFELLRQVFCRLPDVFIETVAVLRYEIQHTTAVNFTTNEAINDIFCGLCFLFTSLCAFSTVFCSHCIFWRCWQRAIVSWHFLCSFVYKDTYQLLLLKHASIFP